jgi:hypothetical protein
MSIEDLEKAEHEAYLNYMARKDDCARKMEAVGKQWQEAQNALGDARKADELAKLRETVRAELAAEKMV